MTRARRDALKLLEEVDRGRRLDVAWESIAVSLPTRDRRWVHETVYGTIRFRGRLDHLLDLHLDRGLESVPPALLRLLRLGAYQVLYMGSVPDYAAVSQTASQASSAGGSKASGLVNAVLRALAVAGGSEERFPAFDADPLSHLSTWGSHPKWLIDRWLKRFGTTRTRSIVDAGNRIPEIFVRPVGIQLEQAIERLRSVGLDVSVGPRGTGTLRLPKNTDPAAVLETVPGIIQDPAAATTADFVRVTAGERVADLCAAPGGKGIALISKGGWVIGLDRSLRRLSRMQASLRRLGMPERLAVALAEAPPVREIDVALIDAPCTGTGTLCRHPDAKWRLSPESVTKMTEVQRRILDGAADAVRPGGRLIYSTCTLEHEENEGVVESFLRANSAYRLDDGESVLRIYPGEDRTDGAFAARLKRVA